MPFMGRKGMYVRSVYQVMGREVLNNGLTVDLLLVLSSFKQ